MNNVNITIRIGKYEIRPHATPDGRVLIEIARQDSQDAHDHWCGPEITIDVQKLFDTDDCI